LVFFILNIIIIYFIYCYPATNDAFHDVAAFRSPHPWSLGDRPCTLGLELVWSPFLGNVIQDILGPGWSSL